ncbi:hypothetical protein F4Z99_17435 [Candidatus Poribacteria bacterium]|nr:hypothetical protein [Candidatus Poribacteria bacterium]
MKVGDQVRNIFDPSKGIGTITEISPQKKHITVKWKKHGKKATHSVWWHADLEVIEKEKQN